MIHVCENMLLPINKIPPEILALIPDFWDTRDRDEDVIALTHVCRAWREVFVSRSCLWTNFDCLDEEKTRVYFERSKPSPINLSLNLSGGIFPCNPFFQIIPHATGRLKSLFVRGLTEDVEVVISHLSHPAPLLERLSIRSDPLLARRDPVLPSALFNGDLSSLRVLHLKSVHTELPWKNMVNLTSFTLSHTPEKIPAGRLLDFFESAPHLEEIELCFVNPTAGAQNRRVVLLECLKNMYIQIDGTPSDLLDHLLIPVDAKLEIVAELLSSLIGVHLPRSLDNLKNLPNFTTIQLHLGGPSPSMKFSGPNGTVSTTFSDLPHDPTGVALESLAELDISKTERLEIDCGCLGFREPLYQALLSMNDLRTLTLSGCRFPHIFIYALQPSMSPSEVVVCPKLEELVLVLHPHERMFHTTRVIEMAAERASRGEKLRTFSVFGGQSIANVDVSELRKHVWNVEYGPGFSCRHPT